jgi:hypothetical protein
MVKNFLEVLRRRTNADESNELDPVAQKLDALSSQLAAILSVLDASSRSDLLAQFEAEVLASLKQMEAAGLSPPPSMWSSRGRHDPGYKFHGASDRNCTCQARKRKAC